PAVALHIVGFDSRTAAEGVMRDPADFDVAILTRCPALKAYVMRVGAEMKNFRHFRVEENIEDGYKRVKATVAIKDGKMTCDDASLARTAAERQAIEAEISGAAFPKSIPAKTASLKAYPPPQLVGADDRDYCTFLSADGEEVQMIQWRKNGEKPDWPITFWSDGHWRMMEPDALLPLYGLERLKSTTAAVMVHEGAMGARRVQAMVDEKREHPWLAELREFIHVGWPGGGDAAHRVDWTPIKK